MKTTLVTLVVTLVVTLAACTRRAPEPSVVIPPPATIEAPRMLGEVAPTPVRDGEPAESIYELAIPLEDATGAKIVSFPDDAAMYTALKGGTVDALLQDLPVNLEHTKDGKYEIVEEYSTDEAYGFAFKKEGSEDLVEAVNDELDALRDSGRYQEIYDTYFTAG